MINKDKEESMQKKFNKDISEEYSDISLSATTDFQKDYSIALAKKVKGEYDEFISDIKKKPADVIFESAYEIVTKGEINQYCETSASNLTQKQYMALMSSQDTLHEVYEQWLSNGELQGFDDIGIALEETADVIQISLDREEQSTYKTTEPSAVQSKEPILDNIKKNSIKNILDELVEKQSLKQPPINIEKKSRGI